MNDKKHYQQYVNAVEYSQHLEQLLSVELKNTSALLAKLAAAERERDEAIAQRDRLGERFHKATQYGLKLKAELARRDAAAGERAGIVEVWPGTRSCDFLLSRPLPVGQHNVYTAAPPAVLPPEYHAAMKKLRHTLAECNRLNYCAEALNNVENLWCWAHSSRRLLCCRTLLMSHSLAHGSSTMLLLTHSTRPMLNGR